MVVSPIPPVLGLGLPLKGVSFAKGCLSDEGRRLRRMGHSH